MSMCTRTLVSISLRLGTISAWDPRLLLTPLISLPLLKRKYLATYLSRVSIWSLDLNATSISHGPMHPITILFSPESVCSVHPFSNLHKMLNGDNEFSFVSLPITIVSYSGLRSFPGTDLGAGQRAPWVFLIFHLEVNFFPLWRVTVGMEAFGLCLVRKTLTG